MYQWALRRGPLCQICGLRIKWLKGMDLRNKRCWLGSLDGELHLSMVHLLSCLSIQCCNTLLAISRLGTFGTLCVSCASVPYHLQLFSGTCLGSHCGLSAENSRVYTTHRALSTTSVPQGRRGRVLTRRLHIKELYRRCLRRHSYFIIRSLLMA